MATSLKVQKVEPYQFVDKEFTIVVTLPDTFPDISRRTSNLPLKVDVCYEEEAGNFDPLDRNYNPSLIDVVTNTNIDRSRRGVVTVRMKDASANHGNRKFIIRFIVFTLEGDLSSVYGYSMPITVVRYKLKIQEEFANQGSYIWMKDVGGKDKSIDLQILLMDTNDNVVVNRKVPLRVVLIYANGVTVPQQDILQLSPDSQLFVGHNGFTRIKCRINEVSSRHQGQLFQICVIPDFDLPSPLADISPARSVPVEVKSKINFSHKRKHQSGSNAAYPMAEGDGEDGGAMRGMVHSAFDPYRAASALPITFPSGAGLPPHSNFMGANIAQLIKTGNSLGPVGVSANLPHVSAVPTAAVPVPADLSHHSALLPLSSVLSSNRLSDVIGAATTTASSSSSNMNTASGNPIPASVGLFVNTLATAPVAVPVSTTGTASTTQQGRPESPSSIAGTYGGSYSGVPAPSRRLNDTAAEMLHQRAIRYAQQASVSAHSTPRISAHPSHNNLPSFPGLTPRAHGAHSGLGAPITPLEAADAVRELGAWTEQVLAALMVMQWTPIGSLQGEINPETKLPVNAADRVLYSMQNPNQLIEALTQRFQSRVAPTLGTLQHYISTSSTNTQDQASSNSTSAVAAATSLRTPTVAAGCAGSSSTAAIATMAVPTVAPQQSAIAASTAYTAVAYNPTSSKTSTTGTDKQKPNSDAFEESSQRLVYMAKYVYAVQRGNSSSGSGEGRREHDLGVAVFGRINEETQFIGFYNKDKQGQLVFRSFKELMSIVNASAITSAATSSSNGSSSNNGSAAASSVPLSGLDHLSNTALSSTFAAGITNNNVGANVNTSASKSGDPVAQLLAQVGAQELFTSLPVSRDPKTGLFDLTLLHEQWRVWADNERLCIHID